MKSFIEEYGSTIIIILVVTILIALVTALKEPITQNYNEIIESFFNKASQTSFIESNII